MAQRKIIFFVIVGIVVLGIVGIITLLNNNSKQSVNAPNELKVWITEGTSEEFQKVIADFKKFAPEYKNMKITVEKKTENPDTYRNLLLTTMSDGNGPDVFMVRHGEDDFIESKVALIPEAYIDINAFERRFDQTVFGGLVVSSGSARDQSNYLMGVPLGYETLGIFYNSSLMRSGIPKTWNQVETLYADFPAQTYATNLGLWPKYVPNMVDILSYFLVQGNIENHTNLSGAGRIFDGYAQFADIAVGNGEIDPDYGYATSDTLRSSVESMDTQKITTLDAFLQGKIGMVIGYPSLVLELEKSEKRSNSSIRNDIYTDVLPQASSSSRINVARFSYFGISKTSENPDAAAVFLQYLMTNEAQRGALEAYPYLIPAQSDFLASQRGKSLSSVLTRAKMDAFLPNPGEKISIFQYGLKSRFHSILEKDFDSSNASVRSSLGQEISRSIQCEISIQDNRGSGDC